MPAAIDHRHGEAYRAARDGPPYAAQTHDPERPPIDFRTEKLRRPPPVPSSFPNTSFSFWDSPGHGEHQGPGKISGRLCQHVWRMSDDDAPGSGCRHIDVVVANG